MVQLSFEEFGLSTTELRTGSISLYMDSRETMRCGRCCASDAFSAFRTLELAHV
jgi:hypothetical protein